MAPEVKERPVFCRHCPEVLVRSPVGWRDQAGYLVCNEGQLIGGSGPVVHLPMPAGLRGEAMLA